MNNQAISTHQSLVKFPCVFTFKAMLKSSRVDEAEKEIVRIVKQYAEVSIMKVSSKLSRNKKYISVSCPANLQNQQQLTDIYQALKQHPEVVVTL